MHSILGDGIFGWSGSIAAIPPGFALCDGTSGTPDLRNKFIVCAGSSYVVDATGGAAAHAHDFTGDGHYHGSIGSGIDLGAGANYDHLYDSANAIGTTDPKTGLPFYFALAYLKDIGPMH